MGKRAKRVERLEEVSIDSRLEAYRRGVLQDDEAVASLVADLGREGRLDAEWEISKLLDHSNAMVRYNALGALGFDLGSTVRVGRMIEILFSDPDLDCRRKAAAVLGSLFRGEKNLRTLGALERVLRDRQEETSVRLFAYSGILDIVGIPRSEQPSPHRMKAVSEAELAQARALILEIDPNYLED